MTLTQTLRRHPLLSLCLLIQALLGLTGALLTLHFADAQIRTDATQYGESLAGRGASQAIEPALSQDLISLQAILQDITQQPRVSAAAIYDVENQLLVQSGAGDIPQHYTQLNFTAAITLDTHIAGHLTVTLALPPTRHIYARYLIIWTLAVLVAMLICTLGYRHLNRARPPQSDAPAPEEDEARAGTEAAQSDDAAARAEAEGAETAVQAAIQVELELLNIDTLQQQLSLHGYQQCLYRFNQLMQGILALYAGEKIRTDHGCLTFRVSADSLDDASFYGICIGHLACTLSQQQTSPRLRVAARILARATDDQDRAVPPAELTAGTIWVDPELNSEGLDKHVTISEQQFVVAILPPYQALLERQSEQLAAAVNREENR